MLEKIKLCANKIKLLAKEKEIKIISHFDTDGITSAAIVSKALSRKGIKFSLEIVKGADEKFIEDLGENNALIFLDLASGNLNDLKNKKTEIFILDHHEIVQEIPPNVFMINPIVENFEKLSTSAIAYLFAKELSSENKDLANLAIIGLVGDLHGEKAGKVFSEILKDEEIIVKKGFLAYPSTRPLDKTLEYSFNPYIPGISGNRLGVLTLLNEAGIKNEQGRYKALCELNEGEMKKLTSCVLLKITGENEESKYFGDIFLVKFFNKLEDARELSALINSCGRMDRPEVALGFCLGNKECKEAAEKIYINYKQSLSIALKNVAAIDKIEGKDYLILNAKDRIKDTIIGTVASIISHSHNYNEGCVIVALAYNNDKIKISARIVGREGRNVRDVLHRAIIPIGGEVGGHPNAAGGQILKEKEGEFIYGLQKVLDVEVINA